MINLDDYFSDFSEEETVKQTFTDTDIKKIFS